MSKYNLTGLILESKLQLTEGTRAMVAYVEGDKLITTYNHYDGYPENLGKGLEAHYNDDAKAKEVASKGYITYLDPETGDIESTHKDPPETITLPSDEEDMAREIAGQIDSMGGNYGYIWDDRANNWVTIKNTGIRSMIDQIMDKMGDYSEVSEDKTPSHADPNPAASMIRARNMALDTADEDDEKNENMVKEEEGFTEVSEKEIRFHLDAYKAGNIDGDDLAQAIEEIVFGETRAPGTMEESEPLDEAISDDQIKKALAGANAQPSEIDQYMGSLKRAGDKFDSLDDYIEDFKEYVANKGLEEHFKRFM